MTATHQQKVAGVLEFICAYSKAFGEIKITANPSGVIDGLRYYRAIKEVARRFEMIKKILAEPISKKRVGHGSWVIPLTFEFGF
jgi:hypothetical protein